MLYVGLGTLLLEGSEHHNYFSVSAFGPTHPTLEYLYYSIGAPQSNFNPLYRHNVATQKSEGEDRGAWHWGG